MSVREIKELKDEVVEVKPDSEDWAEKDFEGEELGGDEEEKFSIGDTMLARGASVEHWGGKNLEEELEGEEFDRAFDDDGDFDEEDEVGGDGFSYESMAGGIGGDLYGIGGGASGDLYGVSIGAGSSGGDLYNTGGDNRGDVYNTGAGSSSLYGAAGKPGKISGGINLYGVGKSAAGEYFGKGKSSEGQGSVYSVGKKKSVGSMGQRRGKKSGLESGIDKPKRTRSKGVSMI